MTLSELIQELQDLADQHDEDDPEVIVAYQPSWPMEVAITKIAPIDPLADFEEEYGTEPDPHDDPQDHYQWHSAREMAQAKPLAIVIGTAWSNEYLREGGATALDWR